MLANIELQKAVYSALTDLGLNVSNGLPINETLPYIQMGSLLFSQGATKTDFGGGYELTLHFWADAYQDIYFNQMIDLTCDLLINDGLTLPNDMVLGDAKITLMETVKDQLNGTPINHGIVQIEFTILT